MSRMANWTYVSNDRLKRLDAEPRSIAHYDAVDLVHTLERDREMWHSTDQARIAAVNEAASADTRIQELEAQVKDMCDREDSPNMADLMIELDREREVSEGRSKLLDMSQDRVVELTGQLGEERQMSSVVRTKATRLQGIVDEKIKEAEALREALETRMLGKCDHETRLIFHIGGDLHLQPIPEAKTTVTDMPPDGILLCRKDANCAARFIGPAARDAHEALHSEDTIGFRCRQKDCTRSLASETALYNHEFSVHGFPKGGVPGAADLEAPKDSTPHGETTG